MEKALQYSGFFMPLPPLERCLMNSVQAPPPRPFCTFLIKAWSMVCCQRPCSFLMQPAIVTTSAAASVTC